MYRGIGHYPGYSNPYTIDWSITVDFLTEEILDKYKKLCEKSADNKIKNNSIIYQSPLSNYPVYKLKNYIEENKLNIKKARKWDKVDTILIDKDFLNEIRSSKNGKHILIPAKEILNGNIGKILKKNDWSYKRYDGYADTSFFYINDIKGFEQFKDYPQIEGFPLKRYHGMKNICDNVKFLTELFDNIEKYNLHVVLDSSIDKEINKDTVIDIEIYENLYNMLNSADEGNTKIAKEIIANCEYEQSKPYILFLASCFSSLLNKSDNKNYHAVYKYINKERVNINNWYTRGYDHFIVMKGILEKYPEYKSIFSQCVKIHLNTLYNSELIKEIN